MHEFFVVRRREPQFVFLSDSDPHEPAGFFGLRDSKQFEAPGVNLPALKQIQSTIVSVARSTSPPPAKSLPLST